MNWFIKRKFLSVIIAAAVAGGGYYSYQKFFPAAAPPPTYVTAKVTRGTVIVSVSGSGQITSSNQINIQPQIAGTMSEILVSNNQKVNAGDVLFRLDATNEERAVRDAKAKLQIAKISLATLESPATTSTILQSQKSVIDAQQSLLSAQNNLSSDYNGTYTDISNTFIDLATVMTGLNNILYSTSINKSQGNIDAYSNMIAALQPNISAYNLNAANTYQTALAAYNQNLIDFKNTTVYSGTSTIESLLNETYATLRAISAANSNAKNLLDLVQTTLQQNSQKSPVQLATDETNMQSYITTTNSHITSLLQRQNSLQSDKQAIATAGLTISQTQASLDQLQSGPTELSIQTQELAVTQTQNALTDAEQNLAYDVVRSPLTGIVTNITAKIAQPVGSSATLATLVGNTQLAQATFNEVDIVNIKVGQKATVAFDALPNLTLTGKVSQVDTLGTVLQGVVSYNVQVALDVPNPDVKPGMSNTLAIITNVKPDVLIVPNAAVRKKQGTTTVQVMDAAGKVTQKDVTVGLANDKITEIVSGLNEGDLVVTQTIKSGAASSAAGGLGGLRIPGFGGGGRGAIGGVGRVVGGD